MASKESGLPGVTLPTSSQQIHNSEHCRNLPQGRRPSFKRLRALELSKDMTDPAHINGVPNLNGENWKEWFFRMENHQVLNGLWEVTKDNPTEEENKEEKTIQKMNSAKIKILNSISMDYVDSVMHCTTPQEVWMAIKAIYQETGYLRERSLKAALSRFKKYPDQSNEQYMNKLVQIVNELKQSGVTTPEKDVITIALNGLPVDYNNLTTILDRMTVTLTLAEIRRSTVHEEAKVNLT